MKGLYLTFPHPYESYIEIITTYVIMIKVSVEAIQMWYCITAAMGYIAEVSQGYFAGRITKIKQGFLLKLSPQ